MQINIDLLQLIRVVSVDYLSFSVAGVRIYSLPFKPNRYKSINKDLVKTKLSKYDNKILGLRLAVFRVLNSVDGYVYEADLYNYLKNNLE